MSGVYAYCVTSGACASGPELAGIGGGPVFLHTRRSLTLWLSAASRPPEPSVATVRQHNGVVETAWQTCDACVPFRFGQWFETEEAADAATAERESELETALARVRGASEFGIRVLDPEAISEEPVRAPEGVRDVPEGAGRAYMEALRQRAGEARSRRERGDAIGDELREALGDLVLDEHGAERPSTPHTLVELAHLVPRGRDDDYRAAVDRARAAHPGLRFLVSGPWPPYSFAP